MKKEFVENIDYYLDRGMLVMTKEYHIKRGECCGKKCRHCPFIPLHVKGNKKINLDDK